MTERHARCELTGMTIATALAWLTHPFWPSAWAAAHLRCADERQLEEGRMLGILVLAVLALAVLYATCGRAVMESPA